MRKNIYLLAISIFCSFSWTHSYSQNLETEVSKLSRKLGENNFSITILDLNDDKELYSYKGDKTFIPASITKLLSTSSALLRLGKDFRYDTKVLHSKNIKNNVMNGDIVIIGSGDPSLESHYFEDREGQFLELIRHKLQDSLKVNEIKGDIIIDASKYGKNGIHSTWELEDIGNYYGVGAYGLNFKDNYMDLYAEANNKTVSVLGTEKYKYLIFKNQLKAVSSKKSSSDRAYSTPFSDTILLEGNISRGKKINLKPAAPDPALYAGYYIKSYLDSIGIKVNGNVKGVYNSELSYTGIELFSYKSVPLDSIIFVTNHASHNLFAEAINREVLYQEAKVKGEYIDASELASYWKTNLNIKSDDIKLFDASGLSRSNRLSSRFVAHIIKYMYMLPYPIKNSFINSLPVAGDNSIKFSSVKKLNISNRYTARLKSGTMKGVRSYAGIINYNGKDYAICFISNNVNISQAKDGFTEFLNNFFI